MTAIVSINGAEALIEKHVRDRLPQHLGQAVVLDGQDRSVGAIVVPQDYGRIDDWPTGLIADPLPALFVMSAGTTGETVNDPDEGVRFDVLDVKIAVLVAGSGEGDRYQSAGMGARLYATALMQLALDAPFVSPSVRILDVLGSEFQNMSQDTGSTVGLCVQTWRVVAATASLTPLFYGTPTGVPSDPDEPVEIAIVDVTVEAA